MGRTGCRVHILRKRGLPFPCGAFVSAYGALGGAVFAAALCWLLGTHVWAIQTEIAPGDRRNGCHAAAERKWGAYRHAHQGPEHPSDTVEDDAIASRISRFSRSICGGNSLTVVAYGSTDPPEVLDEHAVTKVVATRDGVVTQVRALEGQPMVQAGDAVQTGDTLISGLVEPTREGGKYRTAHAHGTVQAYTTHTVRAARAHRAEKAVYG